MDVSDVLRDRTMEPGGLDRMAAISALAHVAIIGALLLVPRSWWSISTPPPKTVMTISLSGGNNGPENGGLTSLGGRAVQAEPPPEPAKPEPVRPPAVETPKMTVPTKEPPTKAAPARPVKQAPSDARGRTPTKGAEPREGSAVAETGARGQGFGLSTSRGVGGGFTLDVADFCCPEYLELMFARIRENWNGRTEVPAIAVVKYTIQRDGTIVSPEIERTSGYTALDLNALRAVAGVRKFQPLPPAFPNPSLTVHLNFQYTR